MKVICQMFAGYFGGLEIASSRPSVAAKKLPVSTCQLAKLGFPPRPQ